MAFIMHHSQVGLLKGLFQGCPNGPGTLKDLSEKI